MRKEWAPAEKVKDDEKRKETHAVDVRWHSSWPGGLEPNRYLKLLKQKTKRKGHYRKEGQKKTPVTNGRNVHEQKTPRQVSAQ